MAAGIGVWWLPRTQVPQAVPSLSSLSGVPFSLGTLEARIEIWSRALYGIQDFPFTGMGMNTFRTVVHVLYPLNRIGPDVEIGHAHNEFLQAALDLGIPGLIAFLDLYMISFACLASTSRQIGQTSETGEDRLLNQALVLGLGGGLVAHLLYGMTDAVALGAKPGVLFWMLLGLVSCTGKGLHLHAHDPRPTKPGIRNHPSPPGMEEIK